MSTLEAKQLFWDHMAPYFFGHKICQIMTTQVPEKDKLPSLEHLKNLKLKRLIMCLVTFDTEVKFRKQIQQELTVYEQNYKKKHKLNKKNEFDPIDEYLYEIVHLVICVQAVLYFNDPDFKRKYI